MLLVVLGTTACVSEEEFSDLHFDHAQTKAELKNQQAQIDALRNVVNQNAEDNLNAFTRLFNEINATNEALSAEFSAVRAELAAAYAKLSQADSENLEAVLAEVARAEESLTLLIANNLNETQLALEALGAVDVDLQIQIDNLLTALDRLNSDLAAEVVDLEAALRDANNLIIIANTAITANEEAIAENAEAIKQLQDDLNNLDAYVEDLTDKTILDIDELRALIATVSSTLQSSQAAQDADFTARLGAVITSVSNAIAKADANHAAALVAIQQGDNDLADALAASNRAIDARIAEINAAITAQDNDRLDELIAALEEQMIDTETYLGQITRLFEEAGYTVNDNVVTKAEATVTIRSTDFILLVVGINISLSNQSLSGDAQDDFDHINSNVVKRLNRLVWEPLTDIFYNKLEWVSDEVVDGIYVETLTGSVTYRFCLLYTSPSPRDS